MPNSLYLDDSVQRYAFTKMRYKFVFSIFNKFCETELFKLRHGLKGHGILRTHLNFQVKRMKLSKDI